MAGLTLDSNTITVSGSAGGVGSNTAASSVLLANTILIQGFAAAIPADVVGLTDLFVTSGATYWDLNIGVAFQPGITTATYTIYYYGS
jgi:hypothetical protein